MSIFTFIKNIFKSDSDNKLDRYQHLYNESHAILMKHYSNKFKNDLDENTTLGYPFNCNVINEEPELISTQNIYPRLQQNIKKLPERDAKGRFKKKGI